jgi:hypothetical protein
MAIKTQLLQQVVAAAVWVTDVLMTMDRIYQAVGEVMELPPDIWA